MLHKAWNSKGEVPYCFSRSSIKFQGHTGQNITDFDPNWAFPDYRPVAAFKSLRFALLKVIRQITRSHGWKKSSILTQIGRFRTVTPDWIHRWLWNVAQSLKQQRRDALLFSKVIHQISRSHGTKHHRFWTKLGISGLRPVAAFKSLRFALLFKKMHLKMWSGKCQPSCLGLNVLREWASYWGQVMQKVSINPSHFLNQCCLIMPILD